MNEYQLVKKENWQMERPFKAWASNLLVINNMWTGCVSCLVKNIPSLESYASPELEGRATIGEGESQSTFFQISRFKN